MNACLIFFRAVGIKVSSYIFFLISQNFLNLHIRTFSDNLPNGERRHAGDHPTTSLHGAVYLVRRITGTEGIPVMVGHTKHDPKTGVLPTEFKQCYPTGKQRCDRGTDWRFSSVWTSFVLIMFVLVASLACLHYSKFMICMFNNYMDTPRIADNLYMMNINLDSKFVQNQ